MLICDLFFVFSVISSILIFCSLSTVDLIVVHTQREILFVNMGRDDLQFYCRLLILFVLFYHVWNKKKRDCNIYHYELPKLFKIYRISHVIRRNAQSAKRMNLRLSDDNFTLKIDIVESTCIRKANKVEHGPDGVKTF